MPLRQRSQFSAAMTTVQRGRTLDDQGRFEESLPCFDRAIAVFEDLGARSQPRLSPTASTIARACTRSASDVERPICHAPYSERLRFLRIRSKRRADSA
jgi:hypothetical protein